MKKVMFFILTVASIFGLLVNCKYRGEVKTNFEYKPISMWMCNEKSGQIIRNLISNQPSGWLGEYPEKDELDPLRVNTGKEGILYFTGHSLAIIPHGEYANFFDDSGFSIQILFKPLMLTHKRIQLLSKGCDSSPYNWQLFLSYKSSFQKYILYFVIRGRKHTGIFSVSSPVSNLTDRWNKVTVTGNKKELKLYLNGILLKTSDWTPVSKTNQAPLTVGAYALDHKFCFNGFIKNIAIYNKEIIPKPERIKDFIPENLEKYMLNTQFLSQKCIDNKWHPLNGNWEINNKGYCEFSDSSAISGVWSVAGEKTWHDYYFRTQIECVDNFGSVLLAVGWQNINNTYFVEHIRFESGITGLYLFKVKDGKKSLLAKLENWETELPSLESRKNMNYKVYFFSGTISIMINNKFYLSVKDSTFKTGKVAIGERNRKIIIKNAVVKKINKFIAPIETKKASPVIISLSNPALRHTFYRGESLPIEITIFNNSAKTLRNPFLNIKIDNGIKFTKKLKFPAIEQGKQRKKIVFFDTIAWKSGKYQLNARLAETEYKCVYKVFIVPQLNSSGFHYYSWGGRTDESFFQSLQGHGFNGSSISIPAEVDLKRFIAKVCDNALKHRQNLKIRFNCLNTVAPYKATHIIRFDGTKSRWPNPLHPDQREWAFEKMQRLSKILKSYPVITEVLLNTECEIHAEPSYDPETKKRARQELGFPMPVPPNKAMKIDGRAGRLIQVPEKIKKATPTVFSDTNRWYRFFKWFWQRGYGDNILNKELAEILKKQCPDIKTTHDPFRDVPLFFRNIGLDQIGTWFYPHPDASETLGIAETLICAAQDEGKTKGINFGASLWMYAYKNCPAKHRQAGVQPTDIILESDWIAFSRIPSVIEHFSLTFLMPPKNKTLEYVPKDLYRKLAQFSKEVLQPFWPTVSQLNRTPRKCAMLISFGSQLFGEKIWGAYGYSTGFGYYTALQRAHIPTDIIFDENIQRGDLKKYKILFMHNITHLPKSVYKRIVEFAKKGGIVVCGEPFFKKIPNAIKFDMDFSKRIKSSYYHIMRKCGFTADQVYKESLDNALKVRNLIFERLRPYVDCNSLSVFLNLLNYGNVKYIFVINDKRTFGDYVGQKYKAVLEQGLPQTVNLTIRQKECVVYDLISHQQMKVETKANISSVNVSLPPAGGKILAVYPYAISSIKVVPPKNFPCGKEVFFTVKVTDKQNYPIPGVQPLKIIITDPFNNVNEFSGYFATINGVAKIKFIPAVNDIQGKWKLHIIELSSGLTKINEFEMTHEIKE